MEKLGIYIHIPFCKQKCKYCDFISFKCSEKEQELYIESLIKEIKNYDYYKKIKQIENIYQQNEKKVLKLFEIEDSKWNENYSKVLNRKITSIYIGGGTPSCIDSKNIKKILDEIRKKFFIDENCEITIEVNPGTITKEKLNDYKDAGINRISIGLQSTNNRLLKLIGRIHTYEDFCEAYKLAKEANFNNINVDLMLALPTQTIQELEESIDKIIKLNPNHISIYSLIIEERTELKKMVDNKELELIDEEKERKMYWNIKKKLENNGYNHYEISNYAKKGFESKHNIDCWNQEEYIGFGLGAHSYINKMRFSNIINFYDYIENIKNEKFEKNLELHEVQDRESQAKEYMLLGFRKIDGISISKFEKKFRINPLFYFRFEISKLTEEGLIEVDLDNIKLTKKGIDLANLVFQEFI